jgi:hypothetical protein
VAREAKRTARLGLGVQTFAAVRDPAGPTLWTRSEEGRRGRATEEAFTVACLTPQSLPSPVSAARRANPSRPADCE